MLEIASLFRRSFESARIRVFTMPNQWEENTSSETSLPLREFIQLWILKIKKKAEYRQPVDYVQPVHDLAEIVENDPELSASTKAMFLESRALEKEDPTGSPTVKTWDEFLMLLNEVMHTAPELAVDPRTKIIRRQVSCPINCILDWTTGTPSGYKTLSNPNLNKYMKRVLNYWSDFLMTPESRYVLIQGDPNEVPPSIAWLGEVGKRELEHVAMEPFPKQDPLPFEEIFEVPDPNDRHYLGFASWDDFFVREFKEGVRPLGTADILNVCESGPFQYKTDVALSADFTLKGQPYSLKNMLNDDPLAPQFDGGTVYQAFLSQLSYHRWHSPVDGVVEKCYNVDGFYYLKSPTARMDYKHPGDKLLIYSQAFLTSVQTRSVVFIKADNDDIGLMAVVLVGMAEVSGCDLAVVEGQRVRRGQDIGTFHFGGSTHCLVFRPGVDLEFLVNVSQTPNFDASNVAVRGDLANVRKHS